MWGLQHFQKCLNTLAPLHFHKNYILLPCLFCKNACLILSRTSLNTEIFCHSILYRAFVHSWTVYKIPSFFLPSFPLFFPPFFSLPVSFHSLLCFSLLFSLFGLVLRLYHQHFLITDLESLDVDWKHVCIVLELFENSLNAFLGTNLWSGIWHIPKYKSEILLCQQRSV